MESILLRSTGPHENFYWEKDEEEEEIYFSCSASHTKETPTENPMQQMVGPEKIFYSLLLTFFTVQQCTINALQPTTT